MPVRAVMQETYERASRFLGDRSARPGDSALSKVMSVELSAARRERASNADEQQVGAIEFTTYLRHGNPIHSRTSFTEYSRHLKQKKFIKKM